MSKQFIVNRHTTPSTPTLDEVPNEKIRVFKNEATIDAALSSLDEDEIVATEDGAESSTRIGNPLGTILAIHSNAVPYGYLPCNGVAFDEHQYPALYALLGDNHTPYSYDKSRLGDYESITISTDANNPTVMQFDGFITLQSASTLLQLKVLDNPALGTAPNVYTVYSNTATNFATGTFPLRKGDRFYIDTGVVQNSAVRYYKHFNVIKATSGLEETQQDYVLQSLLEADNYSTDEVATGKKWIDGKTIYRKVIPFFRNGSLLSDWTAMVNNEYANSAIPSNIDFCRSWAYSKRNDGWIDTVTSMSQGQNTLGLVVHKSLQKIWAIFPITVQDADIVIEYTKAN